MLKKRYPFTISSFNDLLDDFINKRISGETVENAILSYLQSKDFLQLLFNPSDTEDRAKLQKATKDMYVLMAQRRVIKATVNAVEEEASYEGYESFDRSVATFLYTVSLACVTASNTFEERVRNDLSEGRISKSEARDEIDHISNYNDSVRRLVKTTHRIVKRKAKKLSYATNLPIEICKTAYFNVPNPKFINRYQVGFYANKVLTNIYDTVDKYDVTLDRIKWKTFFGEIFGDTNVVEVANYIMLEGMNRINDYKGSEVKEVWNDLTKFALDILEDAPEQIQTQMMDLYTKRVARMFDNNVYELRVDLRSLDSEEYPHLAKIVSKYTDKISEIIKEAAKRADT